MGDASSVADQSVIRAPRFLRALLLRQLSNGQRIGIRPLRILIDNMLEEDHAEERTSAMANQDHRLLPPDDGSYLLT